MNKIILNSQQIDYLKEFIRKKGFSEPVEIHEILDHFACKVEEIMAQNPKLNLDQAMYQAHHSFGVLGFRPIVETFKKQLKKKYMLEYKKSFYNAMYSFRYLPVIIIMGIIGYFIIADKFIFTSISKYWNPFQILLVLHFLIDISSFRMKDNYFNSKNYFIKYAIEPWPNMIVVFVLIFIYPLLNKLAIKQEWIDFLTIVNAIAFVFFTIHSIAYHKMRRKAIKDQMDFKTISNDV